MHEHGILTDDIRDHAQYFSRQVRGQFRLRFKGGLAYQYQWWEADFGTTPVLAESSRSYAPEIARQGAGAGSQDYGGFVMTLEREVFMARHRVVGAYTHAGVFHSSYTGGDRVMMAGTMLIRGGVIRGVRSDSGHYHPTEQNMAAFLQGLAMFGVNLGLIDLFGHAADSLGTGLEFLRSHMTWDQFTKQRQAEQAHRAEGDKYRVAKNLPPRSPQPQPVPTATIPTPVGVGGTGTPAYGGLRLN
jgi:hypothetical protein